MIDQCDGERRGICSGGPAHHPDCIDKGETMTITMDAKTAAALREPFDPATVGKLPRVTCGACRDSRTKNCDRHQKARCAGCGNYITTAHLHLDYVGHAETTDRLLSVDPSWSWEPVAFGSDGLPVIDQHGGLWIRLTVAGVTRLGYGHAEGKRGPDAVKEAIGDAIRNAAMRFGVALDLWGATFKETEEPQPEDIPTPGQLVQRDTAPAAEVPVENTDSPTMIQSAQRRKMMALFGECGVKGNDDATRQKRLDFIDWALKLPKGTTTSSNDLTELEANLVIDALSARRDQLGEPA